MSERSLPDEFSETIERELGPVIAHFTITSTPQGGAPEEIKEQWIGVSLPVRQRLLETQSVHFFDILTAEFKENLEAVPVYGFDAVAALRVYGRDDAADFWADNGFEFANLIFRAQEGDFVPVNVQ
jgi:hypothetical protein